MLQNSRECHHGRFGPFHHQTAALPTNSDWVLGEFHLPGPRRAPRECYISLSLECEATQGEGPPPEVFAKRGKNGRVVSPLCGAGGGIRVRQEARDMEVGVF